jgi:flagellar motor switch protein FliM
MVASRRLGTGLVGTANGRAAVRLTQLEQLSEEDFR